MKTHGVKVLDPMADSLQVDWLVVPAEECEDQATIEHIVAVHFRRPHEPWGGARAYVRPVEVRRTRRRVLLLQHSGLE